MTAGEFAKLVMARVNLGMFDLVLLAACYAGWRPGRRGDGAGTAGGGVGQAGGRARGLSRLNPYGLFVYELPGADGAPGGVDAALPPPRALLDS